MDYRVSRKFQPVAVTPASPFGSYPKWAIAPHGSGGNTINTHPIRTDHCLEVDDSAHPQHLTLERDVFRGNECDGAIIIIFDDWQDSISDQLFKHALRSEFLNRWVLYTCFNGGATRQP